MVKETSIRFNRAARWFGIGAVVGGLLIAAVTVAALSAGGGLGGALAVLSNMAGMWHSTQVLTFGLGAMCVGGFVGAMAGAMTADGEIKRVNDAEKRDVMLAQAQARREQAQGQSEKLELANMMNQANIQAQSYGLPASGVTSNLPIGFGKQQVGPGGTLGA